jgi:hypothetical protein
METQLGQVETGPYPVGIGFHPKENWGAAFHESHVSELIVFNSKSLAKKATYKVDKKQSAESVYIGFGGAGTKVIFATLIGVHNKDEGIVMFAPLTAKAKPADEPKSAESEPKATPKKKTARTPRTKTP